jgi:hypothetical protein
MRFVLVAIRGVDGVRAAADHRDFVAGRSVNVPWLSFLSLASILDEGHRAEIRCAG